MGSRQTLRRVLIQLRGSIPLLLLSLLFAVITVAGNLIVPILFGDIIETLVEGMDVVATITRDAVIILAVVAATSVAQWLTSIINNAVTYRMVRDMRRDVFSRIQDLPLSYIDTNSYGEILSRCISDVETFSDGLLLSFTNLFTGILTIVGTLVLMIIFNWIIAIVVFVVTPVSLLVARFIASRTYSMFKKTSEIRGEQTAFTEEMIGGIKVNQAFSREEKAFEKFDEINDRLTDASMKSTFYSSLTNPCTRIVNAIVYALVAFFGAVTLIYPGTFASLLPVAFNVGRLTTLLSYANQYTKPFNEISEVIAELQNATACAGRVYELMDTPPETPDAEKELGSVKGDVALENVSFSYDRNRKLIEDLSVSVPAGTRAAIVGPTGSGKTTLINLLMRFYDTDAGRITVDGEDIRDVTRKSLRKNYGMVLQETWLKKGTVRENIAFGRPDATDGEIVGAAKAAHAHTFIMQLSDGYDTVIEEDGESLSQGQKQLLCISRILLSLPDMLILDEATSSIDTRTEKYIQDTFAHIMEGRTCFMVAHRLSTIKNSDLILVMRDGAVVEQGTHGELIAKKGYYYELYSSQFARLRG